MGKVGAPEGNQNAKTNRNNVTDCFKDQERGTSSQYALRKLRSDRPDLHSEVLQGKLSAHAGLGEDIDSIKRICRDDVAAMDAIDRVIGQGQGTRNDLVDNINQVNDKNPDGTSRQCALRKLRKSRPDLHSEVLQGKLSPHAAMVQAGFRRKMFTVQDTPKSATRVGAIRYCTSNLIFSPPISYARAGDP